jgi:hypothetical protein
MMGVYFSWGCKKCLRCSIVFGFLFFVQLCVFCNKENNLFCTYIDLWSHKILKYLVPVCRVYPGKQLEISAPYSHYDILSRNLNHVFILKTYLLNNHFSTMPLCLLLGLSPQSSNFLYCNLPTPIYFTGTPLMLQLIFVQCSLFPNYFSSIRLNIFAVSYTLSLLLFLKLYYR